MATGPKPFNLHTERSYQFVRNEVILAAGSGSATAAAVFFRLKTLWRSVGMPCLGSSDAVTAGMDGVDRITAVNKIVGSSVAARSWIVFGHGTGMQILFAFDKSSGRDDATIAVSLNGFTGGSTTARPTATDEHAPLSYNADTWLSNATDSNFVLHMMHARDGMQTMVFIYKGGVCRSMMVFAKAQSVEEGWNTPYLAFAWGYGGAAADHSDNIGFYKNGGAYATARMKSWGPLGKMDLWATSPTVSLAGPPVSISQGVQDPLLGAYPTCPIGLFSSTAGMIGRHGRLADLFVVSDELANGYFPGRTDWVVFGHYAVPWGNGPTPVFTA